MRILVVSQYFYPENFAISEMAFELARRGHEVSVLTGQPNYGFGRILEGYENKFHETVNGVEIIRVKTHPRSNQKGIKNILQNYFSFYFHAKKAARRLKKEFDVVYSMSFSPLISVSAANVYAKKHHVNNILHVLDLWPESPVATGDIKRGSFAYKILRKWSKSIYSKTAELLLSSPSFEDYLRKELDLKMPMVYLAQPAFIPEKGEGVPEHKHAFNLVYSGNIGSLQLVEPLVEAIGLVDPSLDVGVDIFGGGSGLADLTALVKEKGLEDKVTIHGRVDGKETAPYMENADGLVVSLKSEESPVSATIPNKLVTSLYYGRPILATIQGDGRKALEEADGSVFSAGESPEEMARAIETLAKTPKETLAKMGKNNKKYYEEHFAFERLMDHLEEELSKFAKK